MSLFRFLLYCLLISNVILKFFTNYLNLIPKIFNIADLIIVLLLFALFFAYKFQDKKPIKFKKIVKYLALFNVVMIFGMLFNLDYIYFEPAFSQILMYNEGILLFLILVNLPFSFHDISKFKNVLVFLLFFELSIGVMQIPIYFSTGESESIMGTFQHNAEQYTAFIILAIFFIIGKLKLNPSKIFLYHFAIIGILCLILLVDNKASWLTVLASVSYLYLRVNKIGSRSLLDLKFLFFIGLLFVIGLSVVVRSSGSLHKFESLSVAWESGNFLNIGKIKAYRDTLSAYSLYPHMVVTGSGPGTFYSRAGRQFYDFNYSKMYNLRSYTASENEIDIKASNSMGGVITRRNDDPFYRRFFKTEKIYRLGSGTVDEPYSSYAALLGETGIVGTILYLCIYLVVFSRLSKLLEKFRLDSNIFPLATVCLGGMVYTLVLSFYQSWFEVGRMTTILWSMIAMVFKYDYLKIEEAKQ